MNEDHYKGHVVATIKALMKNMDDLPDWRPEPDGPFGVMARNSCGIEKKRYRVAEMRLRGPALPTLDETIRVGHEVLQLSEEELDVELMMEELGK